MFGDEGRDTHTEVDVEAVADLACCTLRNAMTPIVVRLHVALRRVDVLGLLILAGCELHDLD